MAKAFKKPYRITTKKSILKNKFFWIGILIFVAGTAIFYLFIFLSFFQVKEVRVSGNHKIDSSDIKKTVWLQLERRIIFFSSKSIFLADTDRITDEILKSKIQIAGITLKKTLPNIIEVEVNEREPVGVWCFDEDCFSIDKEGIVFNKNDNKSGLIIKYSEERDFTLLGEKIIEPEILSSIITIYKELGKSPYLETKEFIIFPSKRLNVKTEEGWEIYFSLKEDINWQLTKLGLSLEKEIPSDKRRNLEYIELRFGDRVFPKYR